MAGRPANHPQPRAVREAIAARSVPFAADDPVGLARGGPVWGPGVTGSPATCGTILNRMRVRSVLVVGAGIAGSTLSVLLGRGGVSTTLVERAGDQRSTGGPSMCVAPPWRWSRGWVYSEALRAAATDVTRLAAVDRTGRVIGWIPTQTSRDAIEIARSDLAAIDRRCWCRR